MGAHINLRQGDVIRICNGDYQLVRNIGELRGFQFRTWLIKNTLSQKEYVAKITEKRDRALRELRVYVYLKTKGYPDRYYAEMLAFDHEATVFRSNSTLKCKFNAILLKYLPAERYQALDQFLRSNFGRGAEKGIRDKLANKLKRRVAKLHELGICHGDLRAANVMVKITDTGRVGVKIIDFGASFFDDQQTRKKDDKSVERIIGRVTK